MPRATRAKAVMAIQQPTSTTAATEVPSALTPTEVANTATGAAASRSEFCVPSALPRDASGMRSSMKKPSSADAGPALTPSTSAPSSMNG